MLACLPLNFITVLALATYFSYSSPLLFFFFVLLLLFLFSLAVLGC